MDSSILAREFDKKFGELDENGLYADISEESLTSVFSRRSSTGSKSSGGSVSIDDIEDDTKIASFYEGLGWKQVVFLQHNSFWRCCLILTILLHYFNLVYSYHFTNDETKIIFHTETGTLLLVVFEVMYAVDTALSIIYKNWKSIHSVNVNPPRPAVQLCCDLLALIPVEYIYWQVSSDTPTKTRVNTYYCLTSHSLIRIYRVFTFFINIRNTLGYHNLSMRILEMCTYLAMFAHASSAILFILYCIKEDETCYWKEEDWTKLFAYAKIDSDFSWYISSFYQMVGTWTFKGFAIFPKQTQSHLFFATIDIVSFIFIYGFMMGHIVSAIIQDMNSMFSFSHRLTMIKRELMQLRITRRVYEDIITYFQFLWENWRGVLESNLNYTLLPKILHRDLNLDIYGDVFKRSHLFRNTNESFLSFLALKMKSEFYMAGDILYIKDVPKTRMIYLITGIIQILTDEDDDSPIISFSGGTLLGEASLIYHYVSHVVVRCATYCEVQVLETKDFHSVLKQYPDIHFSFKSKILERVRRSKELEEVGSKGLKATDIVQLNDVNENAVKWIKNFFQASMASKKKRGSWSSSVLQFTTINSDVHRTVAYLDLYVFTEQLELNQDDVCLRTTCPWILQPKSMVLDTWNNIIVLTALFVATFLPYCAFYTYEQSDMFKPIMYGVEMMFVLDVLIQTSTAIKRKQELIAEWKLIFYLRLSELGFIADVAAAFPLEIMEYTLKFQRGGRSLTAALMMNKLIKLWKVERYFQNVEATQFSMTYYIREIKYLLYLIFIIYVFGGVFYFQSCLVPECETLGWYNYYFDKIQPKAVKDAYGNFTTATLFSAVVVCGNSYLTVVPSSVRDLAFTLCAMLFTFIFVLYIYSATAAMEVLFTKNWSLFQDTYKAVTSHMKEHKIGGNLQRRVFDYLDFCWTNDNAYSITNGRSPLHGLPTYLNERLYGPPLTPFFSKTIFFKDVDYQLIYQTAKKSTIRMLQPNEVVFYSGEPAISMYIIMQGYCRSVSHFTKNNSVELLGPNSVMNAVEMSLQLTSINTVRTVTCCQLIQLDHTTFLSVLKKYPRSQSIYHNLLASCSEWKDIPELQVVNEKNNIFTSNETEDVKNSWFKFPYKLKESSKSQDDEYKKPFKNLGYFYFIYFLLLRRTMAPNSLFLTCWEISRVIFAFLSSLLFPAAGALEVYAYPWVKYVRYALDATAFVDIYMRLHVAFYDHRGIIISHPLKTSKYYLTHGFLLDFLAVIPLEIFGMGKEDYSLYYYLLYNRVLQIHRAVALFKYFQLNVQSIRQFPALLTAIRLFVVGIIVCNTCGGLLVLIRCQYTLDDRLPERFSKGVYCEHWDYIADDEYKFSEPLSPVRVYLYNVYFSTSIITRCGLGGTMIVNRNHAMAVVVTTIIGFWLLMYMHAKVIAIACSAYVKPTKHQEKMNSLLKFIKTKKISKELREEVINYFELLWKRKKATDANATFSSFHLTLKEDIFLHIYGKNLLKCTVLASANRAFLCKLIIGCRVEIFIKRSTILRPYEISTMIYFINKGKVDLLVAGNLKVCSSLTVGCMFGNLRNAKNYCHNITVVARGHVEVLAIPSKVFHEQLALHPKIQKAYNTRLVKSNSDFYLVSATEKGGSLKKDGNESNNSLRSVIFPTTATLGLFGDVARCFVVYLPGNVFIKMMTAIQLVTSYITFFTCTYAFGWGIQSMYFYGFLLLTDLVFYVRIFLNFQLAYYDDGSLITDAKTIALRYLNIRSNPFGFYYDIVAIFPLDLFCLFVSAEKRFLYIGLLRINRILTAIYVIRWLWDQSNRLNINVILTRFAYITVWITMLLHILTFFFSTFKCNEHGDCFLFNQTTSALDVFLDYYSELSIIICIFTGSSVAREDFMPNSVPLIIYCIFVMTGTRLLAAIFIGEACAIIESSTRTMTHYTETVKRLWGFFTMQDLSPPLRRSFWSYMSLLWRINRGEQVPNLLKRAPYYLREAIKTSLYGDYVQPNPVFVECHEDFLRQLITCLKQYIFFPGNYVTFAGDMDDNMYFVYSGEVEFFLPAEKFEEEEVKGILFEGDAFGMMQGVYAQKEHAYNYRARTVAILLILNRTDWEDMLNSFPAVKKEIYNKASGWYYDL